MDCAERHPNVALYGRRGRSPTLAPRAVCETCKGGWRDTENAAAGRPELRPFVKRTCGGQEHAWSQARSTMALGSAQRWA